MSSNMKKLKTYSYSAFFILLSMLLGCIEEVDFKSLRQEGQTNLLVVEASLTNELTSQEILLSRTYAFEEAGPVPEVGATVRVVDEAQNEFLFSEVAPGQYRSNAPFAAQQGVGYTLNITTRDGGVYSSEPEGFEGVAQLQGILAERITNNLGEEGIAISVNSSSISGNLAFYRYAYDETYKIIAPNWTPRKFEVIAPAICIPVSHPSTVFTLEPDQVVLVEREQEERVCYGTASQNDIVINDASLQTSSDVNKFLVRFIKRDNYILSHRYSILIKQLVQSPKAFSYYSALQDFSTSESIFSEIQPGFLNGNINSKTNSNELVVGYFEVNQVSSQRLFFNYEDFFPNDPLPPYPDNCDRLFSPKIICEGIFCPPLLSEQIRVDGVQYVDDNAEPGPCEGPYLVTNRSCGDCTALGSNVVPDFWEE